MADRCGTLPRYIVYQLGIKRMSTNDLEEAGRVYLESGSWDDAATDGVFAREVFDRDIGQPLHPERDIPCVLGARQKWYWRQQPRRRRILHFFFPATWDS